MLFFACKLTLGSVNVRLLINVSLLIFYRNKRRKHLWEILQTNNSGCKFSNTSAPNLTKSVTGSILWTTWHGLKIKYSFTVRNVFTLLKLTGVITINCICCKPLIISNEYCSIFSDKIIVNHYYLFVERGFPTGSMSRG